MVLVVIQSSFLASKASLETALEQMFAKTKPQSHLNWFNFVL